MRRNRVISDIFNRLHLMERRGSGLIRIISSYNDSSKNPIFNSSASFFKVTFPNKSYVLRDNSLKINQNIVSDEDYFMIKIHKNLSGKIRKHTFDQIQKLFNQFSFQYDFKRENIEEIFNVRKSRASEILALLLEYDLVEPTKYRFKK